MQLVEHRSCRKQVANEEHAGELDKFSQALNCAPDWKCRGKGKKGQSEEPQRSSNSKGNGLGLHLVSGTAPAEQQKAQCRASVIDKSGGVVHLRAPTAKKRSSGVAREECCDNITRAQTGQGEQNE